MWRCLGLAAAVTMAVLAGVGVVGNAGVARGEAFVPPASPRGNVDLSGPWAFEKQDVAGAEKADFDDAAWGKVTVPHTWNNLDGQDGGNNYYRGTGWYRRHVNVETPLAGKAAYLRFEGANRTAEVWVNGQEVGKHTGGFGAFAFDVTKALKAGDNVIAVKVNNAEDKDSPPLSADFTFFGGMYRPVKLILTDAVGIRVDNMAAPGLAVRVSDVSAEKATIAPVVSVRNGSAKTQTVQAQVTVVDAAGNVVFKPTAALTLEAGKTGDASATVELTQPHLWNGTKDPYLYKAYATVSVDGKVTDEVEQDFGVRSYKIDPTKGFILNGQPYALHGVCRHQDFEDLGWAIGKPQMDEDMSILKEMGCTCIRLAHYQHADHFYQLCDKAGIVVWAETPVINNITASAAFTANAEQQETELIRQNINHVSICFWSMGNEVLLKGGPNPWPLVKEMSDLAHQLDPSRLTAIAQNPAGTRNRMDCTDVIGANRYEGWYYGKISDLEPWIEKQGPFAMTEYGCGASPWFHSETPKVNDHSEEYQCIFHEAYWRAMKGKGNIWGTFIWAFADFASDGRNEGDHAGRNDKGMVTYGRTIKKDVFYFYKANWSSEPTIYICSRRFLVRGIEKILVKVFSNAPEVELFVNGQSVGKQTGTDCDFEWKDVALKPGENVVEAKGTRDGKEISDKVSWTYKPGAPKEVHEQPTMQE